MKWSYWYFFMPQMMPLFWFPLFMKIYFSMKKELLISSKNFNKITINYLKWTW